MTAIQNATSYTTYPQTAWYPATGSTWTYNVTSTGTTTGAPVPPPPSSIPAKPKLPSLREKMRALRAKHEERKQAAIAANVLPRIAGGSVEAEVEKKVEQKKKITLKRTVGVPRDKGGPDPTPTHEGELTLVRDMAGNPNQRSSIGIKSDPKGGTSYVEIPISMLREALDELDPPKNGNGNAD